MNHVTEILGISGYIIAIAWILVGIKFMCLRFKNNETDNSLFLGYILSPAMVFVVVGVITAALVIITGLLR